MNELIQHRGEILRALANHKYEKTENGGIFIGAGINAVPMGTFDTMHMRKGKLLSRDMSSNIIPTQGLNHMLATELGGGTQVSTWYIALFEGNVTPNAALTAATFTATTTECIAYDEATRVPYVEGAAASGVLDNAASRAQFTMNAVKTVYGGALLSTSVKSDTGGVLFAAARFATARAVVAADELLVKYTITLTST